MNRSTEARLSALIVLLALPVHLTGLLMPSIYRDPAVLLPQNLGTDLVTLCVGIPLLAATAVATWKGSLRARLLWLGALGYLAYEYGMYALGVRWNPLFLLYAALFALSLYALIIGLVGTDAARVRAALSGRVPVRSVAAYLIVVAVMVAAMVLAAVQLLRDRPWGYVLAGTLLVKAATIGLWVVAMIWFSSRSGIATPGAYTAF